jgi:hypothetical protein
MNKICKHCGKENDESIRNCIYCGNPIFASKKDFFSRLPSWMYIIFFLATIIGVIGGFILFTVAISYLEGFASILFLIVGFFFFIKYYSPSYENPLSKALIIGFFSLMGMALDQPGNYIFNLPIQYTFCESNESLNRNVNVSHHKPGSTEFTQDFRCFKNEDEQGRRINLFGIIGIRFLEYLGIGYLFLWIGKMRSGK